MQKHIREWLDQNTLNRPKTMSEGDRFAFDEITGSFKLKADGCMRRWEMATRDEELNHLGVEAYHPRPRYRAPVDPSDERVLENAWKRRLSFIDELSDEAMYEGQVLQDEFGDEYTLKSGRDLR
jgi:hypothetical protein